MTTQTPDPLFTHLGAKNQLWPSLQPVLKGIGTKKIAEPFAGSAVVSRHFPASKVLLAEASDDVRGILKALATGDPVLFHRQMMMEQVDDPALKSDLYPEHRKAARAAGERIFKDPFGRKIMPTDALLQRRLQAFIEASQALKGAVIMDDAWDLLRQYKNDPDVTWFLDPPYPETCQVGYAASWTMEDHKRLLDVIPKLRGPVVMTGYENMRPPKKLGMKERAVQVIRRIAKGENRNHTEYIWWRSAKERENVFGYRRNVAI
jgi:site-specific DNA-adenine methylase